MSRILIDVNAWNISEGDCCTVDGNPVALALREAGFEEAIVGNTIIKWERLGVSYHCNVPVSVQRFLSRLVRNHEVKIFRFYMPDKGREFGKEIMR